MEKYDSPEEFQEPEKKPWNKSRKVEIFANFGSEDKLRKGSGQTTKWNDPPKPKANILNDEDDLNSLLKEEYDLVDAHRKQVEETMDIVIEQMNLLDKENQPENQLDDYL